MAALAFLASMAVRAGVAESARDADAFRFETVADAFCPNVAIRTTDCQLDTQPEARSSDDSQVFPFPKSSDLALRPKSCPAPAAFRAASSADKKDAIPDAASGCRSPPRRS